MTLPPHRMEAIVRRASHAVRSRSPFVLIALLGLLVAVAASAAEIHDAARAGDVSKVQAILKADPTQVGATDEQGNTPLHLAKDAAVANLLIEAHAALDVKNAKSQNPLDAAGADGRIDVAAAIVDHLTKTMEGVDRLSKALGAGTGTSADAAALAIQDGDLARLTAVLDKNPAVVKQTTVKQKLTPLQFAVIEHWPEGTKLLLERGADPNVRDPELDGTPLHEAAAQDREIIAALLLDHGAQVDAKMKKGLTPLHIAATGKCREVTIVLLEHGADASIKADGLTPLDILRHSGGGDTDAAYHLVLYQKIGAKRYAAWRNLLEAAATGNVADIDRIAGADKSLLGLTTELGFTALHEAASEKQPAAVAALLRLGADPEAKDATGKGAIESASDPETIAALEKAGAVTDDTKKAFLGAAEAGNVAALEEILTRAPKVIDVCDEFQNTALHWSAATGHLEAVKLLLAHGANTKLKNDMGRTPKDDAKKYKFEECVKAFK